MRNIKILFTCGIVWLLAGASGFAADKGAVITKLTKSAKASRPARIIKLDGIELDLNRLEGNLPMGYLPLDAVWRREKDQSGNDVQVRYNRRVKYFSRNKHIAVIESKVLSDEVFQGHLKVYKDDGTKVFETCVEPDKDDDYMGYEDVRVLSNHHVITIASKVIGTNKSRLDVYSIASNEVVFSTGLLNGRLGVPPTEDYILLLFQAPKDYYGELFKYDFKELKKIAEGPRLYWNKISNDGKSYVLTETQKLDEKAPSGRNLSQTELQFYTNDRLKWRKTVKYESLRTDFSKSDKYFILQFGKNYKLNEKGHIISWETYYSILETSDGKVAAEGRLSPEIVQKYKDETINGRGKP